MSEEESGEGSFFMGSEDDESPIKKLPDGSREGYGVKLKRVPNLRYPQPAIRNTKFKVPRPIQSPASSSSGSSKNAVTITAVGNKSSGGNNDDTSSTNGIKPQSASTKMQAVKKTNSNAVINTIVKKEPEKTFDVSSQSQASQSRSNTVTWSALYSKASTRKNKKWENDGFLCISGKDVTLKSAEGRVVTRNGNYELPPELECGTELKLGAYEVQLEDITATPPFEKTKVEENTDDDCGGSSSSAKFPKPRLPTKLVSKPFINPCNPEIHKPIDKGNRNASKPLFDPDAPGALVLPDPAWDHQRLFNAQNLPVVPVVVDPHISKHLRPHQREGVQFLYTAVCLPPQHIGGAILADDMGLGKTLQCIALLWTMHRQGPYKKTPLAKRSLIVTPSSLVKNWEKEFLRWLGVERIKVWAVTSNNNTVEVTSSQFEVIIISYDMAVRHGKQLKSKKFDLMICDEAHKIKNTKHQAYQVLKNINCSRRIMLSGTPVQNDLMELFALVDFVQPGILGTETEFRKEYAKPIEKSQEDTSSTAQRGVAAMLAGRLNAEISPFFLRRDSSVMLKYLPDRVTQIIFCKPSRLQTKLYKAVMNSEIVMDCLSTSCQSPLAVITLMKKLCNHPYLVHPKNQEGNTTAGIYKELGDIFPQNISHQRFAAEDSGKLVVLIQMLKSFQKDKKKVVLVSHSTKTLDVLGSICNGRGIATVRMDGSTVQKDRMGIVDKFNDSKEPLVFLLSSKAGGVGLNLQSASKIILYDIDWNPAHDVQAMARCWRPGQQKETHIYRLLTCGTIEERIYQRQISKQDISGSVIDLLLCNSIKFSPDDLKDIFTFYEDSGCLTHELMGCECNGDGNNVMELENGESHNDENQPPKKKRKMEGMGELLQWEHFQQPFDGSDVDPALIHSAVDFIFRNKSSTTNEDEEDYPVACDDESILCDEDEELPDMSDDDAEHDVDLDFE